MQVSIVVATIPFLGPWRWAAGGRCSAVPSGDPAKPSEWQGNSGQPHCRGAATIRPSIHSGTCGLPLSLESSTMHRIISPSALLFALLVLALASANPAQAQGQSPSQTPAASESRSAAAVDPQRYKANPSYVFFENYILDVLGQLPAEKAAKIQAMNLQRVFGTQAQEWHAVLREALHLSPTLDIAILDLWYRKQDQAVKQGATLEPAAFARDFTDAYMQDGSQVDVWTPAALEAAKARVQARRAL